MLIMGFDGTSLTVRLRVLLATMQPAGVILFKRNIEEPGQTHALLREVQKTASSRMFLCVDLEGGTVDRLRDVIAPVPSVADIAATGSRKLFWRHGRIVGTEARALGFNTDFAPVFDLQLEASRNVLGSRAVSPDPGKTILYAREFLRGLQGAKVLGCGKHFPGLGEADLDSHGSLPIIRKPWKRMWNEDLLPYRELGRDIPFVMVAHAAYPDVTGNAVPASLSKKWMSDTLRKKIGYRGLIITDDLDMGGVLAAATVENAAVETLRAGADIFLVCQKEESVLRAYEAVFRRAERDRTFAHLVAQKSRRVLAAKKKAFALKAPMAPPPSQKTVDRIRRELWAFGEEVRANTLALVEVGQ